MHSIGDSPTDKGRRKQWRSSRYQRALTDWLELGHKEGQVNPHGPEMLETDCHRIDDPFDGEWSKELASQLIRLHLQWKVIGGEPYLLACPIVWSLWVPTVGSRGVMVCCSQKGGPSSGPGPTSAMKESLNWKAGGFPFQEPPLFPGLWSVQTKKGCLVPSCQCRHSRASLIARSSQLPIS